MVVNDRFFSLSLFFFQLARHIVVTINNCGLIIILNDYKIAGTEIP